MGSFLKNRQKTKVSIELPCGQLEAEQVVKDLQVVINKTTPAQLTLLAQAVSNPLVKSQALAKLKEIFG